MSDKMLMLFTCHDAMVSVLGNLDARMLLRSGRVSKSFNAIIRTNGVLRTAVLNSFQGITNVPVVTDYEVYANILRWHYRTTIGDSDDCLRLRVCKALHHARFLLAHFADHGDRLLSSDEFDTIIAAFYWRADALDTMKTRMVVMKYLKDWKEIIYSWPRLLQDEPHFHNNKAIIARISEIASSKFCFGPTPYKQCKCKFPHGLICTNESLIPEVSRYENAEFAYYNPSDDNHDAVNFVSDLVYPSYSDDEDDENSDADDEDDDSDNRERDDGGSH